MASVLSLTPEGLSKALFMLCSRLLTAMYHVAKQGESINVKVTQPFTMLFKAKAA
jgi:hypothetical protein